MHAYASLSFAFVYYHMLDQRQQLPEAYKYFQHFVVITTLSWLNYAIVQSIFSRETGLPLVFQAIWMFSIWIAWPIMISIFSCSYFMTVLDILCAVAILDKLTANLKARVLTLSEFDCERKNIENTYKANFYYTSSLICVCLLQVGVFIGGGFFLGQSVLLTSLIIVTYIDYVPYFLYLYFVFRLAADVNEKGDFVTHSLARGLSNWAPEQQMSRMSLYIDSFDDPISYYLVGLRMTRRDLLIQIIFYSVSFVIGVVQSVASKEAAEESE